MTPEQQERAERLADELLREAEELFALRVDDAAAIERAAALASASAALFQAAREPEDSGGPSWDEVSGLLLGVLAGEREELKRRAMAAVRIARGG